MVLGEIVSLLYLISSAALIGCVFFAPFAKYLRSCATAVLITAAACLVCAAADVRMQGCDLSCPIGTMTNTLNVLVFVSSVALAIRVIRPFRTREQVDPN